jgi:hypothetical protein
MQRTPRGPTGDSTCTTGGATSGHILRDLIDRELSPLARGRRGQPRAPAYAAASGGALLADAVVDEQRGGLESGAGDGVLCAVLPSGTD